MGWGDCGMAYATNASAWAVPYAVTALVGAANLFVSPGEGVLLVVQAVSSAVFAVAAVVYQASSLDPDSRFVISSSSPRRVAASAMLVGSAGFWSTCWPLGLVMLLVALRFSPLRGQRLEMSLPTGWVLLTLLVVGSTAGLIAAQFAGL